MRSKFRTFSAYTLMVMLLFSQNFQGFTSAESPSQKPAGSTVSSQYNKTASPPPVIEAVYSEPGEKVPAYAPAGREILAAAQAVGDDYGNDFASAEGITIGTDVQGNIEEAGDADYFKFTPSVSGIYSIESTGNTNVYGYLYNSDQAQIAQDNNSGLGSNFFMLYQLNAGQTYYLIVNQYSGTGLYGVRINSMPDDFGNGISSASPIGFNSEIKGDIQYACDVDYFKFSVSIAGSYIIESTGTTDTYGILYNSSGGWLASNYDISGTDKNFRMNVSLAAGQTYYVSISHNNYSDKDNAGTGIYGLRVLGGSDDHGNDFDSATLIQVGSENSGNIESSGDVDYFKFVTGSEGAYAIETTGSTNTYMCLYKSNQSLVSEDNNSGTGSNAYITNTLPAGQTYFVRVSNYSSAGTGAYGIKVVSMADDFGNAMASASYISVEAAVYGEIQYANDLDFFKFTVSEKGPYIIESTGTTDMYGYLYTESGGYAASASDISTDNRNFKINMVLSANTSYYLSASCQNSTDKDYAKLGSYGIRISRGTDDHGNDSASATSIQTGMDTKGNIESNGDDDYFKIVPVKSGMYTIETTGTLNTYGCLYNSSLGYINENNNNGMGSNFYMVNSLTAGQTYYIRVYSYNGANGEYVLKVNPVEDDHGNDFTSAKEILLDEEIAGEITYVNDSDVFKFTAAKGGTYNIKSTGTTDTYGVIYNSNGNFLASGDNASAEDKNFSISFSLASGQTCYITVTHQSNYDRDAYSTGAYGIKLTMGSDDHGNSFDSATLINIGEAVAGNIESSGDDDYFKFVPSKGGIYTVESTGTSDMYGYLYDGSQGYIEANNNNGLGRNFYMVKYLNAGQTYYLRVLHNNSSTGEYAVKVTEAADDHGNDNNTSTILLLGADLPGEINYECDLDVYKFTVQEEGTYIFESTGTTDTFGMVYDSTGSMLASNYDASSTNRNFLIAVSLAANKTYYLHVYHQNYSDKDSAGKGAYSVKYSKGTDDYGNTFDTAAAIKVEETVNATMDGAGDIDMFKFTVPETKVYIIESTGITNVYGYLYNEAQAYLNSSDNNGTGSNFYMAVTLNAGESYYLDVRYYQGGDTGAYAFKIYAASDDHGNEFNTATTIKADVEYPGSIEYAADCDVFKLTATDAGMYVFETYGNTDTFAYLYSSSGNYISSGSGSSTNLNFLISANLSANTVYYLKVYHQNNSDKDNAGTGLYTLRVYKHQDDYGDSIEKAVEVPVGMELQGKIGFIGDQDYVSFTPSVTGSYTIETAGNTDTYGTLYDSAKAQAAYDNNSAGGGNFRIIYSLTAGQLYYLNIRPYSTNSYGEYKLRIFMGTDDYGNEINSSTSITIGTESSCAINYGGDVDFFKFTPSKNAVFNIVGTGSSDTYAELYDYTGSMLGYSDNAGEADKNFSMAQSLDSGVTYYIKVRHADSLKGTGPYALRVLETGYQFGDDHGNSFSTATLINEGLEAEGTINYPSDIDFVKFIPSQTGMYVIESTGTTNTCGFLYDSSQGAILYNDDTGLDKNFYIAAPLTEGQTYYLKVYHQSSAGTGIYTLRINYAEDDYDNDFKSLTELKEGTSLEGVINYPCDNDVFRIVPQASGTYIIESSGSTDTEGKLFNSIGGLLYSNDDENGLNKNFHFAVFLTAGQTYYLKAAHKYSSDKDTAGTGAYTVASVIDKEAPSAPEGLEAQATDTSVTLTWNPATDDTGVKGYDIYRNGEKVKTTDKTNLTDSGLAPDTRFTYYVKAFDEAGKFSEASQEISAVTVIDDIAPSTPSNIVITALTGSTVSLKWTSSTDNIKVLGYEIYRDAVKVGNSTMPYFTDSGLAAGITYKYTVKAFDTNNLSGASGEIAVTPLMPEITSFSPQNGLTLGGTGSQRMYVYFKNTGNAEGSRAEFEYSADGTRWNSMNSTKHGPYSQNTSTLYFYCDWSLNALRTDTYSVRYSVYDAAGNSDTATSIYMIDRTPPSVPHNIITTAGSGTVNLQWEPSPEADTIGYRVYRADTMNGTYSHIGTTNGRTGVTYSDNSVQAGKTYYYRISSADKYGQESEKSEAVSVIAQADTVPPVILGIEPVDSIVLGRKAGITVRAEDNLLLSGIKLQYSLNGLTDWVDIASIATRNNATFTWDLPSLDGNIYVRAIARDAAGNESDGSPVRTYIVDQQGPSRVMGLTAAASTTIVTLRWNDVPENDFAYFQVERKDLPEGSFISIGKEENTLGMNIKGLKPDTSYRFRVVAYDRLGNRGAESEEIAVKTMTDIQAPVITVLEPRPGRFASRLDLKGTAADDVGVSSFTFQLSYDKTVWIDLETFTPADINPSAVFSYSADLSSMPEGPLYIRAIARDEAGNISDTSPTAAYMEHRIDRTAPSKPANFTSSPTSGYITLSWIAGNEPDLSFYRLYRSETEAGAYTLIADKLKYISCHDSNVLFEKTYYYKLSAVDSAGNESIMAGPVAEKLIPDTEKPRIVSFSPKADSKLSANPKVGVLASDNYKLSKVTVEYKPLGDAEGKWSVMGSKRLDISSEAVIFDWNTKGLHSGIYSLRASAEDQAGNISETAVTTYELNVDPPAAPVVTALAGGWKVDLSWTSGNEEDLAGFRVYRSTAKDTGYRMIKETRQRSFSDTPLASGQTYYYKIEAVDSYNNSSMSEVIAAAPGVDDPYEPTAEAGIEMTSVIGAEVQFDGTLSKDNNSIASYLWDFGDGVTANTAQPVHAYTAPGIYTVKLTVADPDGNKAEDTTRVLVYLDQQIGTLEVKVIDNATGAVIPGASVYVDFPDDTPRQYTTNGDGMTNVFAVAGNYNVSAYKNGYLPLEINTAIKQYQKTPVTIRLKKSELVVGRLEVRRMALEEIMAAGINVQAPENQHVYSFAVHLVFEQKPLPVEYVFINGRGDIVSGGKPIVIDDPKGTGGCRININAIPHEGHPEVPPTLAYMVISKQATWLKEFFEVGLILQNMADPQFVIKDSSVTLKLPNGVSLAPTRERQGLTIDTGDIAGKESRQAKWIIRGDKEGQYKLEANFKGTLMPFEEPVTAVFKTEEPFRVWAGEALHIYVYPENAGYIGEEYYVHFEIKNVSDTPVYNVKTNFGDFSQPNLVHEVVVIDPYGNKTVVRNGVEQGVNYKILGSSMQKYLPSMQPGDSLGIDVLYPGESIFGTYKQIFNAPGDKDEVYYVLKEAFSTTCGGTTEVPVSINGISSHVIKYKVILVDEGAYWADPVDTTTGAHVIEREALSVMGSTRLSFDLDYNSLLLDEGTMGKGWSHNYETRVSEEPDGTVLVYWSASNYTRFLSEDLLNNLTYGTVGRNGIIEISGSRAGKEMKLYPKTLGMKGFVLKRNLDGTYELTCKNGNTCFFDAGGQLVRLQDKNGRYVTVTKNAEGRLIIKEPVSGQTLTVSYNGKGLVESVADMLGRKVVFIYDDNNCLTEIKDAAGKTSRYSYDADGRVLTGTDSDGITYFTNTYEEKGRVATQDDGVPGNGLTKFSYDDTSEFWRTIVTICDRNGNVRKHVNNRYGQLVRVEDELGNKSTYTYDADGNKTSITDPKGNTIIYTYDSKGNILTVSDEEGTDTVMTYDDRGNLLTTENAAGERVVNTYNSKNLPTSATDQRGNRTDYEYNDNGQIASKKVDGAGTIYYTYEEGRVKTVTDYCGSKTEFEYDAAGRITKVTDREGKATTYGYDANDNLISETDPMGHKRTYTYDSRRNKTSAKDERGYVTYFKYNGNGKLIEAVDPKGNRTRYEYDGEDRLVKTTDAEGNTSRAMYDAGGRVLSLEDALGKITGFSYDSMGEVLTKTLPGEGETSYNWYKNGKLRSTRDAAGNITTYGYDTAWRVNKITNAANKSTTYVYDEIGNLLSETDPLNHTVSYTYDKMGSMSTKTDARGNVTKYSYNANGKLTGVTDALDNKTGYRYDKEDRLIKIIDAKGNETSMEYDGCGNMISIEDALGNKVTMEYDEAGNRKKTIDAYGNVVQNTLYDETDLPYVEEDVFGNRVAKRYDSMGRLVEVVDALNKKTGYYYDELNRLIKVIDPQNGESRQTFDSDGNLKTITDPNGNTAEYLYDEAGRLVSETTAIGSVKTYGYNSQNLLEGMINGRNQKTVLNYDDAGRLISFTDPAGTVTYTYDANGNVLTVSDSAGKITREYDELNRVTRYTDCRGNEVCYSYDSVGNLLALTYPGGRIVRYEYDAANRLTRIIDWENRVTGYRYDNNGRLVKTLRPDGTVLTNILDAAGRIDTQKDEDAAGNIINQYSYTYDATGKITVEKSSDETQPFYIKNTVMTYGKGNKLLTYNGKEVRYDADGNMIYGPLDGKMTDFEYDPRNRLIRAGDTTYLYDAENNRIAQIVNGVRTDYINNPGSKLSQLLISKDSQGKETFFVYGLGLIGQQEADGAYRTFHYDLRGSTTAITDIKGNVTDRFQYAPFGELVGRTGSTDTPFLYNGMYGVMTDKNGLYYMRARYYNPDIKRFINQDIVQGSIMDGRSLNRYAYCNGNPVSLTDPFGLSPELTPSFIGHTLLDLAGFIPGIGEVFDVVNAAWYLAEGDYMNAALSGASMIPFIGSGLVQSIKWGSRAFRAADITSSIAAFGGRALDLGRTVGDRIVQGFSAASEAWRNSRLGRALTDNPGSIKNGINAAEDTASNARFQGLGDVGTSPWLADPRTGVRTHLEDFREGGSFLVSRSSYERYMEGSDIIGYPDNSLFITRTDAMDRLISQADGDISIIESRLGFPSGYFSQGGGIVRIDVLNPLMHNIRMPSGFEMGANEFFRWGGYTSGGMPEAVIDRIPNLDEFIQITNIL